MISRALALAGAAIVLLTQPASAEDPQLSGDDSTNTFTGVVIVESKETIKGSATDDDSDATSYVTEPVCQGPYAPGETCISKACEFGKQMITIPVIDGVRDESNAYAWCPTEQASVDPLPGRIATAFAQVPVPAAELSIQPPKGKTLVGLETIFSTTTEPFTRTLSLLGRRVQLRITPSSFTWHHGDGTTQTSDWPGRAWDGNDDMDRYLTHTYEHTGTVHPRVTVTWSATWRIGTGPWRTVDGTVTRAGVSADLAIVEAEPELVVP